MQALKKTEDIGQTIRDERKAQGLTQDDLAGLSGTGRRFISELESGKPTIQLEKTLLVLNALGLSLFIKGKWDDK